MHIKQVIISGFRSFRNQQEVDPFSSKHNVIVGRNGSGKSNYFDAIQFVLLGPKFGNLRQEDRHLLLHEGAGSSVMAAYVEIIFDNSDGRLSVESEEVVLRRTVGHKKDEFFINRKRVQKSEVQSLLESAGFSKSNPYYIVQQGKVANLCVMKDTDRLTLLKDIAGTTVYEERRNESLAIMKETATKQDRIEEVLTFIEERLTELEKEKEELSEYDVLDKHRRALEYSLYDKELSKATEHLSAIEEDALNSMKTGITLCEERRVMKRSELERLSKEHTDILVRLQETKASSSARRSEIDKLTEELNELNTQIDEQAKTRATLDSVRLRIEQLYGKQGRGRQFTSREERDDFLKEQIASLEKQERSVEYEALSQQIAEAVLSRNQLQDSRKSSWRELENFQEKMSQAKQDLDRGQKQLDGYYGPVIDNFRLKKDVFRTAVEVAGGNSLFHVIISAPNVKYPDSQDVRPLVDVALDFEPDFEIAIKHVFGSKLLARDLDVASHYSKECNLDAITREGDMKIRDAAAKILDLTKEEAALRAHAEALEVDVTEILQKLQKLESSREHVKSSIEQFSNETVQREKALESSYSSNQAQKEGLRQVNIELTSLSQQISFFKQEMKSDLAELDASEKNELVTLSNQERTLQASLEISQKELASLNSRRETLKANLKNHLLLRRSELEEQRVIGNIESAEEEQAAIEKTLEAKQVEITRAESMLEAHRLSEQKAIRAINEATKMHDKLLNKRAILMETIQTKQKLIRELGTLPRHELDAVKALSEHALLEKMTSVNEGLKKFAGVNRKALEQYVSFNEQRTTLLDRQKLLNEESDSITKLIESLDQQKEEAILRTFRGVSKHFSEVFAELVKGGQGKLLMRTSDDMADIHETESDDERTGPSVASFRGVQVRVSFSGTGQQQEMRQLSGGQKALVALALIFAIQRSDPAPFYLFDEIDQALDANYRLEVAKLIERQATSLDNPAQFITTTFRPEMVEVAHKHYGIALVNKTSNIYPLKKAEASAFVLDLANEEESLGAVTSIAAYGGAAGENVAPANIAEQDDDIEDPETTKARAMEEQAGPKAFDVDSSDENPEDTLGKHESTTKLVDGIRRKTRS
eukprot:GSChrysophyteH1.ASY1.ANO1.1029.1 assembled CDS